MNKKTLTKYESDNQEFSVEVNSEGFFLTNSLSINLASLISYHTFLGEIIQDNGLNPVVKISQQQTGHAPAPVKQVPSQFAAENYS